MLQTFVDLVNAMHIYLLGNAKGTSIFNVSIIFFSAVFLSFIAFIFLPSHLNCIYVIHNGEGWKKREW